MPTKTKKNTAKKNTKPAGSMTERDVTAARRKLDALFSELETTDYALTKVLEAIEHERPESVVANRSEGFLAALTRSRDLAAKLLASVDVSKAAE